MRPDARTAAARRHKGNATQPEDAAPHEDGGDLDDDGCHAQRGQPVTTTTSSKYSTNQIKSESRTDCFGAMLNSSRRKRILV